MVGEIADTGTHGRRKLILFTISDPETDPGPVWEAYHFARTAVSVGVEAEVRLAAAAVKVALPDGITDMGRGRQLKQWVREGKTAGHLVSV